MPTKTVTNLMKAAAIIAAFTIASCNKELNKSDAPAAKPEESLKTMIAENGNNPDEASITAMQSATSSSTEKSTGNNHYLYTQSNAAAANSILAYNIRTDGSLRYGSTTASGGAGTGVGLGSQGALVLSEDHKWLFAVNAGSNSVSSFKVGDDGSLTLVHTATTHGTVPVSVTTYNNMLYVLNHGTDNIHGFWIGDNGKLTDIANSTKNLSTTGVDAPQISFSPFGDQIIVTEKNTNIIGTFKIRSNGSANAGIFTPSVGATPFGFAFSRDKFMIVSNAAGGAAGAGSATSYTINSKGIPNTINGYVPDFQAAPCWFAITKHGRFAYTTNTTSNTISSYFIAPWGGIYLVQSTAAETDVKPLDIVVAYNNYFVYELNGTAKTIGAYRRSLFGGLKLITNKPLTPAAATGLATY